ncbi:GGDEF domain-containing protein [Pseudoxanthomonas winnipegensis]|uniref:diguanylate cyclase n=1 Tax=Pseudoxanthomonas winnipegensis TaxID=2480810 RepID=A0A4Q8LNZ1_9GAMM|nr:GGDEF domain-containing protein [Pseudoxanthomonas winnipegensis]RZZ89616.1 GGDEF domain-containing protein [Pseudoxanthomonas winnipegensis]TAA32943.1 GGDEF domain-containing protein [Pseudoxanthomonas winnipegensis]TBV78574.1 GGDEF domain-containing protein [Pseudoxanthomonas winnipegensis]
MPSTLSREHFIRRAGLVTLALTSFTAGATTLVNWLRPIKAPMDLVVPPLVSLAFAGLFVALKRRPQHLATTMRLAVLVSLLALAAPAWFYTWQAATHPGLRLIESYPPLSALLLALLATTVIFLPPRQAIPTLVLCWLLVAGPVLGYLFTHPQELHSARGADLVMTYGPCFVMIMVLLPVHRGLAGRIRHLVDERTRMEAMVNRDALTQLYNRRFCELVLQDLLARHAPVALLMFDLDNFKTINDSLGHAAGDAVLQAVADCCQARTPRDACASRWGGDEFVIVLPSLDSAALQDFADQLCAALAALTLETTPRVTASLGMALAAEHDTPATLMQRVDQAQYRAKHQGGNRAAW